MHGHFRRMSKAHILAGIFISKAPTGMVLSAGLLTRHGEECRTTVLPVRGNGSTDGLLSSVHA